MISTSSLAVYREWEEEDEEDFSLSLSLFSLIYFLPFWLGFFVSFPADVFDPTITPRSLLYTLASSLFFVCCCTAGRY